MRDEMRRETRMAVTDSETCCRVDLVHVLVHVIEM